jgi:hypothetical protein
VVELRPFAGDTSHLLQSWRTAQPEASHRREPSDSPGAVVHLHVPTENFPRELNPETLYFVLRDASGHRVAEARMRR